jgi:hypothetical protein
VKTITDAGKQKQGRAEALRLAKSVSQIVVARGKRIVSFDMRKDKPSDDTLSVHLLGPTGNLRAPTMRVGSSLYVGFNEVAFANLMT